jgi:hypothetical protein
MGKRALGLRYAAALAAILHAAVIVHVVHPLFHAQAVCGRPLALSAAHECCSPACTCARNSPVVSSPSVERLGFDCPICKFLLHHPPQNLSAGTSGVSYEVAQGTAAEIAPVEYVSLTHSCANARAPPSCTPAATSA